MSLRSTQRSNEAIERSYFLTTYAHDHDWAQDRLGQTSGKESSSALQETGFVRNEIGVTAPRHLKLGSREPRTFHLSHASQHSKLSPGKYRGVDHGSAHTRKADNTLLGDSHTYGATRSETHDRFTRTASRGTPHVDLSTHVFHASPQREIGSTAHGTTSEVSESARMSPKEKHRQHVVAVQRSQPHKRRTADNPNGVIGQDGFTLPTLDQLDPLTRQMIKVKYPAEYDVLAHPNRFRTSSKRIGDHSSARGRLPSSAEAYYLDSTRQRAVTGDKRSLLRFIANSLHIHRPNTAESLMGGGAHYESPISPDPLSKETTYRNHFVDQRDVPLRPGQFLFNTTANSRGFSELKFEVSASEPRDFDGTLSSKAPASALAYSWAKLRESEHKELPGPRHSSRHRD